MGEAPVPPRRRVRYLVAAVVCVAAIGWMLFGALRQNLVYLRPVSEAVERRDDQGTRKFRMGGSVVPGSIEQTDDGVVFELAEGGATAEVVHHGDPPDLFADDAPVVVEGRWQGQVFDSERLLIKHGSEYSPPTDAGSGGGDGGTAGDGS